MLRGTNKKPFEGCEAWVCLHCKLLNFWVQFFSDGNIFPTIDRTSSVLSQFRNAPMVNLDLEFPLPEESDRGNFALFFKNINFVVTKVACCFKHFSWLESKL